MPHNTNSAVSQATETAKALAKQKSQLESELAELLEALSTHGVDMKTSLVDAEGYPKSGLDIMAIRSLRQKIIHLQNDLKGVMNQVKVALENLHELKSLEAKENALGVTFETNSQSSSSSSSSVDYSSASSQRNTSAITSPTPSTSSFTPSNPFARVDTISPNSPASICGLLTGDLILQFGTLKDTNFTGMTSIASLVRDSENAPIDLIIDRRGEIIPITLTPRRWSGQGLLGCLIVPLSR